MSTVTTSNLDELANAADQATALLKTLSHKDRLMILCVLKEKEISVGEIAEILDLQQSPLSQHLARMRKEGLVKTRRDAQTIYYSIDSTEVARIIDVVHSIYCADPLQDID